MYVSNTPHALLRPKATGIEQVLGLMKKSLNSLEIQCSYSTQMKLIEETRRLPSLPKVHEQNYESSYHRTTSIGCLSRIQAGNRDRLVVGISIRCMIQSREADLKARDAVNQMKGEAATDIERQWVESVDRYLEDQLRNLEAAMRLMRNLVGEQMWHYAENLEY